MLLTLSGVSAAEAQSSCTGQAGTSALEQYCEAIPRDDGGRDNPGSSGKPTANGSVSSSTAQALAQAGADGAAVASLAGEAPKEKGDKSQANSSGARQDASGDSGAVKGVRVESPADPASNPLQAATKAAASGPVTGPALVWGLVGLSTIGAVAAVVLRRREGLTPPGHDDV